MIEVGYERVQIGPTRPVRWWLFLHVEEARPQAPRRGVVDRGFRFARGGVAVDEPGARHELETAKGEARREWQSWVHQPSHALGPRGELIPLDEVLPELGP